MTAFLGILGVLIVGALWLAMTYNGLVSLRNDVANAFKQIDVQLQRRYDVLNELMETVKGSMQFEKDTLEAVTKARSQAQIPIAPGDVNALAEKAGALTQALGRLMVVMEKYPDIKSTENIKPMMEEISHTENQLGFARQFYNDLVTRFNTMQQTFPTNLIAGNFGFTPAQLFELPESAAERSRPKIDLSLKPNS